MKSLLISSLFVLGVLIVTLSVVSNFVLAAAATANSNEQQDQKNLGLLSKIMKDRSKAGREEWKRRIATWKRRTVMTSNGPIIGAYDDNVTVFLGVPFAASTAGENRWLPAQPRANWTEPRDATWYGKACPQSKGDAIWGLDYGFSEDCLSLDIYMPTRALQQQHHASDPLPIMTWLFGGCYAMGSSDILYNGANDLVHGGSTEKPVIFVVINYRVSVLGFLGGEAIRQSTPDGSTGTAGITDQRAAMAWVKKNAAAFGGDPDRLTIFGESAGGGSVGIHLTSPPSWPYFTRALAESGPAGAYWETQTLAAAEKSFAKIAAKANCPTTSGSEALKCLKKLPWKFLAEHDDNGVLDPVNGGAINSTSPQAAQYGVGCDWAPTVDNVHVFDPRAAVRAGRLAPVPVLVGTNRNEIRWFLKSLNRSMSDADYRNILKLQYPDVHDQIYQMYPPSNFGGSAWEALSRTGSDHAMTCPTRELAVALASAARARQHSSNSSNSGGGGGAGVFVYMYDHMNWLLKQFVPYLGVPHMVELFNVWDLRFILLGHGEKRLADMFIAKWTQFAHTGNPNAPNSKFSYWAPFTKTNASSGIDTTFRINTNETGPFGVNQQNMRKPMCDMWRRFDYPS